MTKRKLSEISKRELLLLLREKTAEVNKLKEQQFSPYMSSQLDVSMKLIEDLKLQLRLSEREANKYKDLFAKTAWDRLPDDGPLSLVVDEPTAEKIRR